MHTKKPKHPIKQILQFSITGSMAATTHFITVLIIVQLSLLQPLNANIIGFFTGFIISFCGHNYWTFAGSKHKVHHSLIRFLCIASVNLFLNQSLFYCLFKLFNWPYMLALLITLLIMASLTFTLGKYWAFKQ